MLPNQGIIVKYTYFIKSIWVLCNTLYIIQLKERYLAYNIALVHMFAGNIICADAISYFTSYCRSCKNKNTSERSFRRLLKRNDRFKYLLNIYYGYTWLVFFKRWQVGSKQYIKSEEIIWLMEVLDAILKRAKNLVFKKIISMVKIYWLLKSLTSHIKEEIEAATKKKRLQFVSHCSKCINCTASTWPKSQY